MGNTIFLSLFNKIFETGNIPTDGLLSTFVMIQKKNATKCSDYCTISQMSHVLKISLRILHYRIHNKIEEQLNETQLYSVTALEPEKHFWFYRSWFRNAGIWKKSVFLCYCLREGLSQSETLWNDQDSATNGNSWPGHPYYWKSLLARMCKYLSGQSISEEVEIQRVVRQWCI